MSSRLSSALFCAACLLVIGSLAHAQTAAAPAPPTAKPTPAARYYPPTAAEKSNISALTLARQVKQRKKIKVGYYSATAPAPSMEAEEAQPNPDGSIPFLSSRTNAVPLKQNSGDRSLALYNRQATERDEWVKWDQATPALREFIVARDPATAANLKPGSEAYFRVFDLDGDGKMDLIVRFGSRFHCSDDIIGCTNAVYYADNKPRVLYHARKFLPAKNGVMLNNKFYYIMPKGGEDFTVVSYMLYAPGMGVDRDKTLIGQQLRKIFPEYYEQTQDDDPGFNYGKYDLNNDGRPEYIVQITEDDEQFDLCDPKDGILCPMAFYTQPDPNKPLVPLGHFLSMQDLVFARTSAPGFADIITSTNDVMKGRTVVYSMNPQTGLYELDK